MKKNRTKLNILAIVTSLFLVLVNVQQAQAIRIGLSEGVMRTYVGSSQNAIFKDANTGNVLFVSRSFFVYYGTAFDTHVN